MLSSLTTKLALKKVGLSSKDLDFSAFTSPPSSSPSSRQQPGNGHDGEAEGGGSWTSWMTVKSLPLTVHPWFSPPPPPVDVARVPRIGDVAPLDQQRKLVLGRKRRVLVVFLRCVGCAFAQKTFLNLRTLANRYNGFITCIAVSHSSERATRKWIDMLGGAWNVQVIIDEERAIYAAWGLGVGNMWYLFNPTTQVQGWKETGWLGEKVAGAIQKGSAARDVKRNNDVGKGGETVVEDDDEGPSTELGNKWQEAGAFAVDGMGTVIWGGKAMRADDVMDLEEGAKLLMV